MKKNKILLLFGAILIAMSCISCEQIDSIQNAIYTQSGLSYDGVKSAKNIETIDKLCPVIQSCLEKGEDVYFKSDKIDLDTLKDSVKKVSEQYGYYGYISSYKYGQQNNLLYVQFTYIGGKEEYIRKTSVVKEKVNSIVKSIIKPNWSDFQKELAIHDYIINNTIYDYKNYHSKVIPDDDNTAYGVFVNGLSMCGGYSEAMHRLLTASGVESKIVIGDSKGEGHAWNIVKINGAYYHIDVTFDDPVGKDTEQTLSYKYFNLTNKDILKDHTYVNADYPSCNNTEYNYFIHKNLIVDNKRDFSNIIKQGMLSKEKNITMKTSRYSLKTFNPDTVYDVLSDNRKIKDVDISHGFQYTYDKDDCIMNIFLKYK